MGARWRRGNGAVTYEIELRPPARREGFSVGRAPAFLSAGGTDDSPRGRIRCAICGRFPKGTGFLPCGILFGLVFAWYLDNAYVPALDFEMRMLQWPASRLLPYQVRARARHRELGPLFPRRGLPERLSLAHASGRHCLLSAGGAGDWRSIPEWSMDFHVRKGQIAGGRGAICAWWCATDGNSSSARTFPASW